MMNVEKMKKYLIDNKILNLYTFEMIMNRIKKNVAFLNFLTKKNFLKDSRYFKTMALDFVINSDFEPKLLDIKGSPFYNLKNQELVNNILNLQNQILNLRSSKILDYIFAKKQEIYTMF